MGEKWKTKITKIEPNKITVRGVPIDEMMGKVTYAQALFHILKGRLPNEDEGKLLDAILVSSIDHGTTPPSSTASRYVASGGADLSSSVAAGILAINRYHGGAIENAMRMFYEIGEMVDSGKNIDDAVSEYLTKLKEQKKRASGFGHRYHTNDPRARKLFSMAKELGYAKKYIPIAEKVQEKLKDITGKDLPINVDGAIGAVLCELDFPAELGNAFFMVSRMAGLIAHVYEEKTEFKPMRKFCPQDAEYDEG